MDPAKLVAADNDSVKRYPDQVSIASVRAIESIVDIIHKINTMMQLPLKSRQPPPGKYQTMCAKATAGVQEVHENVNQTSAVAGELTEDTHGVSQSADAIKTGGLQVNESATELSEFAEKPDVMVSSFITFQQC